MFQFFLTRSVSAASTTHPMADSRLDFKEDRERPQEWGVTSYGTWLRGVTLTINILAVIIVLSIITYGFMKEILERMVF